MKSSYSCQIPAPPKSAANWRRLYGPRAFLFDKLPNIILVVILSTILTLLLLAYKIEPALIIIALLTLWLACFGGYLFDYYRRRNFYMELLNRIHELDKAYLVLETLEPPKTYDGKILYEALYSAHKSMLDEITLYSSQAEAFKEYIELWIHETKAPLATLSLLSHNPTVAEQITRLDNYIEQVLYYTRAENAEHDYHIAATSLATVVNAVAAANREILQAKHIDFEARNLNIKVQTDSKWLKFILNQIITNSIKYRSTRIEIFALETPENVTLKILDNGIGISAKDLPRVFEKSFTGENGHIPTRSSSHSTGMGLYIAKTLCDKLGHDIKISAEKDRFTLVEITFRKHDYFNVAKT